MPYTAKFTGYWDRVIVYHGKLSGEQKEVKSQGQNGAKKMSPNFNCVELESNFRRAILVRLSLSFTRDLKDS